MIICIDPGHGGRDPGGGTAPGLFVEKELVLSISAYQAELLRQKGFEVVMTREGDQTVEPGRRDRLIRTSGADLAISNHINACGNPKARGLEIFRSIYSSPAAAEAIAAAILACGLVGPRTGLPVIQTRTLPRNPRKDYYHVHRETGAVPVVLIEYGFATNPNDAGILARGWQVMAAAVVEAIESLGVK